MMSNLQYACVTIGNTAHICDDKFTTYGPNILNIDLLIC